MNSRRLILLTLVVFICLQFAELILHERAEGSDELPMKITTPVTQPASEDISKIFLVGEKTFQEVLQKVQDKFGEIFIGEKKINADRLIVTSLHIASDAQMWLKPMSNFVCALDPRKEPPTDFKGLAINLESLGYPTNSSGHYTDSNGSYETEVDEGEGIFIIRGRNSAHNNLVVVKVSGKKPQDIVTEIRTLD